MITCLWVLLSVIHHLGLLVVLEPGAVPLSFSLVPCPFYVSSVLLSICHGLCVCVSLSSSCLSYVYVQVHPFVG